MGAIKQMHLDLIVKVNADVIKERFRQNELYGVQRHTDGEWLAILIEEVGEVAQAMQIGSAASKPTDAQNKYKELIQVAAVAKAWAEQVREEVEQKRETEQKPPGVLRLHMELSDDKKQFVKTIFLPDGTIIGRCEKKPEDFIELLPYEGEKVQIAKFKDGVQVGFEEGVISEIKNESFNFTKGEAEINGEHV